MGEEDLDLAGIEQGVGRGVGIDSLIEAAFDEFKEIWIKNKSVPVFCFFGFLSRFLVFWFFRFFVPVFWKLEYSPAPAKDSEPEDKIINNENHILANIVVSCFVNKKRETKQYSLHSKLMSH